MLVLKKAFELISEMPLLSRSLQGGRGDIVKKKKVIRQKSVRVNVSQKLTLL